MLGVSSVQSCLLRTAITTTEETGARGPSVQDKCLVGCVWAVAAVYGCLTDQILSKEVDIPCSVR